MKNTIIYFSGTGNTYSAAVQIHQSIDNAELIKLDLNIKALKGNMLVLLAPSYGYGLPGIFYKWLKIANLDFQYTALIITYGTSPGPIASQTQKLLRKKKKELNYFNYVKSVENFLPFFKPLTQNKIDNLLTNQVKAVELIINDLNKQVNKEIKECKFLYIISYLFRKLTPLLNALIKVNKNCNQCGICIKHCPAKAISLHKRKIKIKKIRCQNCQSCLNRCPKLAIKMLRFKQNTPRYLHPEYKN